jgi:ferredoxin-NADP reductase
MLRVLKFCLLLVVQAHGFAPSARTSLLPSAMGVSFHVQGRSVKPIARAPAGVGRRAAALAQPSVAGTRMSEKKPDVFVDATVTSNTEACEGMRRLVVKVGSGIASSYKVPGQYTKARADAGQEKPGFYAMCSAPGATTDSFEFLIKRTPANDWGPGSGWICDLEVRCFENTYLDLCRSPPDSTKHLQEGASLQLTEANGGGYKYAALGDDVTDVLLFATGSGVAPLKATIESGELKGKNVKLYYGCRTAATMPFCDLFESWDCEVIASLSQPAEDWQGRKGYIQDALKTDGIREPSKTAALLCGVKGMTEGVSFLAHLTPLIFLFPPHAVPPLPLVAASQ